jgi:hypothetical protein
VADTARQGRPSGWGVFFFFAFLVPETRSGKSGLAAAD